ncbi:unnamed protein product [Vitrella brassicaformis CCMP3155]|uniref:Uncharacterized protein n=1 Tax=Vitrella brassicaformis (strain CCMP3155) TaxID=1169540 RepID=A0A0G4G7Q9_VITBC|nr:unnamed protein product [Vitrella brassicaformis CCMP3155]|eukprot:CEM24450.1 unnamed protein product [Vitrella brassicaformis CCMP3155]
MQRPAVVFSLTAYLFFAVSEARRTGPHQLSAVLQKDSRDGTSALQRSSTTREREQITSATTWMIGGVRVVDRPATWEEARQHIESGRLDLFARNADVGDKYRQWRGRVTDEYVSMGDSILINVLGLQHTRDEQGRMQAVPLTEAARASLHDRHWLVPNDYPYSFEDGVSHLVCWALRDLSAADVEEIVEKAYPPDTHEYLYFINPTNLRTIESIHHWHVLVRRKSGREGDKMVRGG